MPRYYFPSHCPALLRLCLLWLCLAASGPVAYADVVKPALIEISAFRSGSVELDIRASIEALLTGINARYTNTQEAPTAAEYDALRVLPADELERAFNQFESEYLDNIRLYAHVGANRERVALGVDRLEIPEPGYTKVPRISALWLKGQLPRDATAISLHYPTRFSDYAVRVRQVDLDAEKWHWSSWDWVRDERDSEVFSLTEVFAQKTTYEVISEFTRLGFLHILPLGTDHILFILGLFLFATRLKPLLWQVTMFTLAHTVTLGLATAGYVELPARIVEPLIALSIAYVGIENLFASELHRHRLVLVFAFGLLHGLGFASVLADFELPADAFFTSLLSFNVGVEFGQLALIALAWLAVGWYMPSPNYRRLVIAPWSLVIGLIGIVWTLERLSLV